MQAFANEVSEKIERSLDNEGAALDEASSLFSAGDIIFPDENAETISSRYGYSISGMNFLVPESTVSEVIQNPNIFDLPNSPYWIEGLINIRGNIIPVMNIDKYLKNSTKGKKDTILILNKSDEKTAIAFLISELPVSLEISESKSSTNKIPGLLRDYVTEGFVQKDKDWMEFNPQRLFEELAGNKE